jgi:hypothetical protein
MATGVATMGYVSTDHWQTIEPRTLNYALWEIACGTDEGNHN